MPDIATIWNGGSGDWVQAGPDLLAGDDLETAALISLFTDHFADADEMVPDGSGDRRGWWGDLGELYPIGSKLWLLERSKQTALVLQLAQSYCTDALAWMLADGVAASIEVVCSYPRPGLLGIAIVILRTAGGRIALNYGWAWAEGPATPPPPRAVSNALLVEPSGAVLETESGAVIGS